MHRAVGEIHEERLGGMGRPQLVDHAQGLVGQVVGEEVAAGVVVDVDVVVVLVQPVGLMEVGEGVEDPVVAVEAPLQRPAGLGSAVAEVGVLGEMPLAEHQRGPARVSEDLGHQDRVVPQLEGVAGKTGVPVGNGGHAGHVVVESREQRGPGGRAHGIHVEVGVAQALGRQAVQFRGVDLRSVAAQVGVAEVVGHHHDHVGGALRAVGGWASGARRWRRSCRRCPRSPRTARSDPRGGALGPEEAAVTA